jgi:hypothetical protein
MVLEVEISSFDLRFEDYRLRNPVAERILFASISENGIRDPLQGVDAEDTRILLNGFKRYRCAKKLKMGMVPYSSLSSDTGMGIVELLRMSNAKSLGILEQARLVEELKDAHGMSTADIAGHLEKSKAWVSVRPFYAYMYILRPFIRINKINREDIDEFVGLVSKRNLSIRDIELLAKGYFKGSDEFREQLRKGNLAVGLQGLREISGKWEGCPQAEQAMLRDLELAQVYMQRITARCEGTEFKTSAFFAQANLLTGGILRQLDPFAHAVRQFHDRTGKA